MNREGGCQGVETRRDRRNKRERRRRCEERRRDDRPQSRDGQRHGPDTEDERNPRRSMHSGPRWNVVNGGPIWHRGIVAEARLARKRPRATTISATIVGGQTFNRIVAADLVE